MKYVLALFFLFAVEAQAAGEAPRYVPDPDNTKFWFGLGMLCVVGFSVWLLTILSLLKDWTAFFRLLGGISFIGFTILIYGMFFSGKDSVLAMVAPAATCFGCFVFNYAVAHVLEVGYKIRDDISALRVSDWIRDNPKNAD